MYRLRAFCSPAIFYFLGSFSIKLGQQFSSIWIGISSMLSMVALEVGVLGLPVGCRSEIEAALAGALVLLMLVFPSLERVILSTRLFFVCSLQL
jgi:hypothetical protein